MKKAFCVVFCAAFFAVCAFFSLGMLIPGASVAAEGAEKPVLVEDGKLQSGFGEAFETWFSRSFAYRSYVVDAFSALRETCFRTGNDQVIVGRDGFLFFAETTADYEGSDPMTEEELNAAADALLALYDYAQENGAAFLFAPAPNKNTIYPEKMPGRYARNTGESDLDRLFALLGEREIPFLDVRPLLLRAKEDGQGLVYHRRDTHWNAAGAEIAAEAILDAFGIDRVAVGLSAETCKAEGDLESLLYPGVSRTEEDTVRVYESLFTYKGSYKTPMDMRILTQSGGADGKLTIFRDSFGSALIPPLAAAVKEVSFLRAMPYRMELDPNGSAPQYVVVEIAERNLRSLIGSDENVRARSAGETETNKDGR